MKLGGKKENNVMENCASTDLGSRVDINEFIHLHFLLLHCSVKHLLVHILSPSMIEFKLLTRLY